MPPNDLAIERAVLVPADIDEVNRVFAAAFTDRYHRDGMTGVRVPELNPAVWRYAIAAADAGAMVWRDERGIAAFNLAHANGVEGWMGPLAVRPDRQGRGLGRAIVTAGIEHLERSGCVRIGLETMPRTVENIGFYGGLGFVPGHLTISMVKDLQGAPPAPAARSPSRVAAATAVDRGLTLVAAVAPGLEWRREFELTVGSSLGDLTLVGRDGGEGLALWHSVPLSTSRTTTEIRILKLLAPDRAAFRAVVDAVLAEASRRRLARVAIRCQTEYAGAYRDLVAMGFRVQWTDLRMERSPLPTPADDRPIVFSNWEI